MLRPLDVLKSSRPFTYTSVEFGKYARLPTTYKLNKALALLPKHLTVGQLLKGVRYDIVSYIANYILQLATSFQ